MRSNYIHFDSPQFRFLSDNQIEELHSATLQILERAGVAFASEEAIDILGQAGADVSNPERVKIPSHLVEEALRTAPKTITLYSREGNPAIVLDGQTGPHFGTAVDMPEIIDPFTQKRRLMYIEDIADMARLCDALPHIERVYSTISNRTIPTSISDKVGLLQLILNTSMPVGCQINDVTSLKEMLDLCAMVAGGEEELRKRLFLWGLPSQSVHLFKEEMPWRKACCVPREVSRIPSIPCRWLALQPQRHWRDVWLSPTPRC